MGARDEAIESFEKAEDAGVPKYLTRYAIAETEATTGDIEAAFKELGEAIAAGYAVPEEMESDPDFGTMRQGIRITTLLEHAKRNAAPCKYAPESRQFDFLVGEWNVVTSKGEMPAGDSRIELSLGDCVIVENWSSKNSAYAGKSYNVYNTADKRWERF